MKETSVQKGVDGTGIDVRWELMKVYLSERLVVPYPNVACVWTIGHGVL